MHDGQGTLLNCNADSVASAIALGAAQIAPAELVFCFEKSGVLRDPDDETTLIREITAGSYAALKAEGVVSKGMIPKIENALKAVAIPAVEVHISAVETREDFRQVSYAHLACFATITGEGLQGYAHALELLREHLEK